VPIGVHQLSCLLQVREWVAACDKASLVFMDGMTEQTGVLFESSEALLGTMWSHHRRTEVLRQRLFLEKFIGDVRSVSSTFNAIPGTAATLSAVCLNL
jgi:hypothetical protein